MMTRPNIGPALDARLKNGKESGQQVEQAYYEHSQHAALRLQRYMRFTAARMCSHALAR